MRLVKKLVPIFLLAAAVNAQPERMQRAMLEAHNAVRSRVGVGPLTWSSQLEAVAREWANSLLARSQFSHRPKAAFGENLFDIKGARTTPYEVVAAWAEEARLYDYPSNTCRGVCGHYTQIVWADTLRVGCAVARNARREVWVCNYDPPGNWVGSRPW